MRYLITKSLLDSWVYIFDCHEGQEEEARASFMSSLLREKSEPTEAMMNGIEFENNVYDVVCGKERTSHPKWESGIQKIASYLYGAALQIRCSKELTVCGMDFLVYGILDALCAGTIYDVKFRNKKFANSESDPGIYGKYFTSSQHPAYFYIVPQAYKFQYLVSDGEDVYVETYTPEETPFIGDIITDFIEWLKQENLLDTYKEHWCAR